MSESIIDSRIDPHVEQHMNPPDRRRALAAALVCFLAASGPGHDAVAAIPGGLLFHASFDGETTRADIAGGSADCSLDVNLNFRSAQGVVDGALLQEPGERCSYAVPGNLDTSRGSFSVWVKPLSWDGSSRKFRHFLTVTGVPAHVMLLYLYPIGDEAVVNYIRVNAKTPEDATWRAGAPVDLLKRNEWTHLVSTWDDARVRLYANGKRVGEGLVSSPLPKAETGVFTVCPVEFWPHAQWSDPEERTVCDEVRVFDHSLSDDEVLDLYAAEIPGGLPDLVPAIKVELEPDYFARTITVRSRMAHFDDAWTARLDEAVTSISVADPRGRSLKVHPGPDGSAVAHVPEWLDGAYVGTVRLLADRDQETLLAGEERLLKPPTPWLPGKTEWRAERVLEPWTPLVLQGGAVKYWNGAVTVPGAFPKQITSNGGDVLAAPIRLVGESAAEWGERRVVEEADHRVAAAGSGVLGTLRVEYEVLMEFDGLIRTDLTLRPPAEGADLDSLAIEIPVRSDVAVWYRNPTCAEWSGEARGEPRFLPYGWLGSEERGLSWFTESDANWRVGPDEPYTTLRPEGTEGVVARLHLISEPTHIDREIVYTIGFEATPVRPPDPHLYARRWAGGPYVNGVTQFVYGWSKQISSLNGRLLAHDPAHQRAFVDKWRAKGMETLSYTCTQCTANLSPEYCFFGREWNQPYGSAFSGYKRVPDDAPYSMVAVCPRSSFADFLAWCVTENLRNDWGGGIYTDIDGAKPCDNRRHGCGFTDAFGRSGRTWPIYAHRALSRRIYEACHEAGKLYFSHAHSDWYAPFNAFNNGWAPGEQYSHAVSKNPYFYMEELPDRVWRSEFYTPTTGVPTYLLPQIGRLGDRNVKELRGPAESCYAAAMLYGAPLWASLNKEVVQEVWAAQIEFGMENAVFLPFWRQQDVNSSNTHVRVSLWKKPERWLAVAANFTATDQRAQLRLGQAGPGATFSAAWLADSLVVREGVATVTVPARGGMLLTVDGVD